MAKFNLEDAAKNHAGIPLNRIVDSEERYFNSSTREYDSFIEGAKWQQEKMYSEEDIKDAFTQGEKNVYLYQNTDDEQLRYEIKSNLTPNEWFEQFKK